LGYKTLLFGLNAIAKKAFRNGQTPLGKADSLKDGRGVMPVVLRR
jgi:hypothetical protein